MGVVEGMREMVAKELGEEDDEWQVIMRVRGAKRGILTK